MSKSISKNSRFERSALFLSREIVLLKDSSSSMLRSACEAAEKPEWVLLLEAETITL
jgi:hypothetical protein